VFSVEVLERKLIRGGHIFPSACFISETTEWISMNFVLKICTERLILVRIGQVMSLRCKQESNRSYVNITMNLLVQYIQGDINHKTFQHRPRTVHLVVHLFTCSSIS